MKTVYSQRRGRLQVYLEILSFIREGLHKPTIIMYKVNLSWVPLSRMFELLMDQGLIMVRFEGKRRFYYLTRRGRSVLRYFDKARDAGLPVDRLNRVLM